MSKLFADSSQIFTDFYTSLNSKGQLIFVIMLLLLIMLLGLLAFTSVITYFEKKHSNKKEVNIKKKKVEVANIIKEDVPIAQEKQETLTENIYKEISKVVENNNNINLTDFELEQENLAIISYEELKNNIDNIEFIDDEEPRLDFMDKKRFTVSEVISPIFGKINFDQTKAKDSSSDLEKSNI